MSKKIESPKAEQQAQSVEELSLPTSEQLEEQERIGHENTTTTTTSAPEKAPCERTSTENTAFAVTSSSSGTSSQCGSSNNNEDEDDEETFVVHEQVESPTARVGLSTNDDDKDGARTGTSTNAHHNEDAKRSTSPAPEEKESDTSPIVVMPSSTSTSPQTQRPPKHADPTTSGIIGEKTAVTRTRSPTAGRDSTTPRTVRGGAAMVRTPPQQTAQQTAAKSKERSMTPIQRRLAFDRELKERNGKQRGGSASSPPAQQKSKQQQVQSGTERCIVVEANDRLPPTLMAAIYRIPNATQSSPQPVPHLVERSDFTPQIHDPPPPSELFGKLVAKGSSGSSWAKSPARASPPNKIANNAAASAAPTSAETAPSDLHSQFKKAPPTRGQSVRGSSWAAAAPQRRDCFGPRSNQQGTAAKKGSAPEVVIRRGERPTGDAAKRQAALSARLSQPRKRDDQQQ